MTMLIGRWCDALVVAALVAMAPGVLSAQRVGVFSGVVTRDTLGNPVGGAEIALPGLKRALQTNERGEFRFADVPEGMYLVTVRAMGFAPFADSISIKGGQTLDGDLSLSPSVAVLDTLRTLAIRSTLESRALEEFETRRKAHVTGAFISDSVLRANDAAKLSTLIGQLAGARFKGSRTEMWLVAGHDVTSGGPAFLSHMAPCFATVYIDGRLEWSAAQHHDSPTDTPPNLGGMRASDYAGVEFYQSATQAPLEFTQTGSSCGVLLLWSRKSRLSNP